MEDPGAEAAAAAAAMVGAAAPAAGNQQHQLLLPADVAARIRHGEDVFNKRPHEAKQVLDACSAGAVAAYTAAGQPAAIMRGAAPAKGSNFPLQREACFFVGQCQASGLQQTGGVLGYRPALPGGQQEQEQLALEPAPAGIACKGSLGRRPTLVTGPDGEPLFFKNQKKLDWDDGKVTVHAYYEAESVANERHLTILDVKREQKQPEQEQQAGAEQEAGGSAAGSGSKQPAKLTWYTTLVFGQDHGFEPGKLPSVQFAQAASVGQPQWGAPVAAYSVPDELSLVFMGKLDGKGKMGKVEGGMLVRECARQKKGGAMMLHLRITTLPSALRQAAQQALEGGVRLIDELGMDVDPAEVDMIMDELLVGHQACGRTAIGNKRARAEGEGPADLANQELRLPAGWRFDAASGELVISGPVRIDGDLFVDGTIQHRGIQQLCSIAFKNVHGLITFNEALTEVKKMPFRHFAYKHGSGGMQAGIIAEEALAAGSAVASCGPDGVPVFDQGSALALIGRAVQWLQKQHASMASTLKLLLITRLVEDGEEAAASQPPSEAAAEPSGGGSSSSSSDSEDSSGSAGGRPPLTREEAAAALERQLSEFPPEEIVELINQLLRDADLPPEVAARNPTLKDVQKNKKGQKVLLHKFLEELPLDDVAAALQAARFDEMPHANGSDRPLSRLGYMIKQLKQRKLKRETSIDTAGIEQVLLVLRDYQEEVLQTIQQPGNFMLVAPTGVGKTAIATMLAARLLKAGGKAIFLAPTTSLVRQQTLKFAACKQVAELGRVDIRCGGLSRDEWAGLLAATTVLLLTPQTLLNMFQQKVATFDQFQLLIMDECHDAKGYSAMAELLRMLRALPAGASRPKVFGMTATPGAENTVPDTVHKIEALAGLMGATGGRLVELRQDDPRLAPFLVKPNEIIKEVEQRAADTDFCKRLGALIVFAAKMLHSLPRQPLPEEPAEAGQQHPAGGTQQQQQQQGQPTGDDTSAAAGAAEGAAAGVAADRRPAKPRSMRAPRLAELVQDKLLAGQWVGQVEGWNREVSDFVQTHTLLSPAEKREAARCLRLLCYCLDALHVTLSVGYEAALRAFVHQFTPFGKAAASAGSVGVSGAADAGAGSGVAPADAAAMEEAGPAAASQPEPAQAEPAGTAAEGSAEPAAEGSAEPAVAGAAEPAEGGQGPEQPAANSKVPLNALLSTLVNKVTEDVVDLSAINDAFSMTTACSPKFAALCNYLLEKLELAGSSADGSGSGSSSSSSGGGWHGIVFARTRASVMALRELLASRAEVKRVTVAAFMGGGNKSASNRHRGMSKSQQSAAIDQFTAAEFGLLLATAAGEQGLDFPNCEFVVRYSVNETGQERLQSQGRARKAGGEYLTLLDVAGSDPSMDHRSRQQARNQGDALRQLAHTGGAVRLGSAAAASAAS